MEEKAKVTATPTIAEMCGIKYKEVDGLYYPILGESEPESYASLGKYGHRYLRALMENDRYLYNKYFMQGVLLDKAAEYENYAWQLYDTVLQGINKVNDSYHVEMERLSRKIYVPVENGKSTQRWYYERARGQYMVDVNRQPTPSLKKKFKALNPKSMCISSIIVQIIIWINRMENAISVCWMPI